MTKKYILFLLITSLILTVLLSNCTNSIFIGVPVFVYSIFPIGMTFLVIETYLYSVLFVFLLLWVTKFRMKFVFYLCIIGLFALLNIIASEFTKLDFFDVKMLLDILFKQ